MTALNAGLTPAQWRILNYLTGLNLYGKETMLAGGTRRHAKWVLAGQEATVADLLALDGRTLIVGIVREQVVNLPDYLGQQTRTSPALGVLVLHPTGMGRQLAIRNPANVVLTLLAQHPTGGMSLRDVVVQTRAGVDTVTAMRVAGLLDVTLWGSGEPAPEQLHNAASAVLNVRLTDKGRRYLPR